MTRPAVAPAYPDEALIAECLALVAPAEAAFRSRWRFSTLVRLDAELAELLQEQIHLYNAALLTGPPAEAREQSAAMVRGWRAAVVRLEAPLLSDDAYLVGRSLTTGLKVVIGQCKSSVARVQAMDGENVIFMTPDEVAQMVGGLRAVSAVKSAFPDAEVVELYPQEDAA